MSCFIYLSHVSIISLYAQNCNILYYKNIRGNKEFTFIPGLKSGVFPFMFDKTGESRRNWAGGFTDYDAKGKKIGESRPNWAGGYTHYDTKGHKTGESRYSISGYNHYDAKGHKTGEKLEFKRLQSQRQHHRELLYRHLRLRLLRLPGGLDSAAVSGRDAGQELLRQTLHPELLCRGAHSGQVVRQFILVPPVLEGKTRPVG